MTGLNGPHPETARQTGPNTDKVLEGEEDLRPIIARKDRSLSIPIFMGVLTLVALILFTTLNARRQALSAPETRVSAVDRNVAGTTVPKLYIPPDFVQANEVEEILTPQPDIVASAPVPPPQVEPQIVYLDPPPSPPQQNLQPPQRTAPSGPVLAFDRSARQERMQDGIPADGHSSVTNASRLGQPRVQAGQLSNPSNTIVRGTIIPVALETALDSTRPGQARAIVSRNVYGFDGRKILVPRGSRLIGEYDADLARGQNRILVQWVRLLRPDGATIALDSGSADRLGRAGVRGKVDSKFLERFGDAILRTSLDVGSILLTREISDGGLIVAVPGAAREVAPQDTGDRLKPTLRVKQGAALSVFVARDLDFTPVEVQR